MSTAIPTRNSPEWSRGYIGCIGIGEDWKVIRVHLTFATPTLHPYPKLSPRGWGMRANLQNWDVLGDSYPKGVV
ncbi:MAG: hypothetical protein EBV05_00550 [Cyanobacteria bacterium WB6_1B_304]|nr:hypothetical protein [Cyanobacteria bacterium WB6_1B_304]